MRQDPTTHRLTKRQIDYYYGRICRLLRTAETNIIIKRMNKHRGLMDPETKDIWLDPEDRILPSIIHECLHALYPLDGADPKSQEDWTLKLENKIAKRITERQMKNLLIILSDRLKWSRQSPLLQKKK